MEERLTMTGRVQENLIEVRRGDSLVINIQVKKCCAPMDLSGAIILMQVREKDSGNLVFEVFGTEVDAKNGKIALIITPEMTKNQIADDYITDIELTTPDGSVNTLWPADINKIGTFRITPDVTDAA